MTLTESIIGILIAGAIGGFLNALFSDNGLRFPNLPRDASPILKLGFVGNIIVGAIAGVVSCALAGIFKPGLTVTELIMPAANALLVGISGARWLSSQAEKKALTLAYRGHSAAA